MYNAPVLFESDRLIFREFTPDDAPGMFELNLAPEVLQFTGDAPFNSIDEARSFIIDYTQYQDHGYGRWTVLLKDSNEYIGWCGLKYIPDYKDVDLGYRLLRKYWGLGLATEASKASLNYGFNQLNLNRIVGRAHVSNLASIRVLEKAGLTFEKEMDYHIGPTVQYVKTKN